MAEVREVAAGHGVKEHLASDRQLEDDLLGNVAADLWACKYGIGLVQDRVGRGLTYNAADRSNGVTPWFKAAPGGRLSSEPKIDEPVPE